VRLQWNSLELLAVCGERGEARQWSSLYTNHYKHTKWDAYDVTYIPEFYKIASFGPLTKLPHMV
jgi:hypothetical protein